MLWRIKLVIPNMDFHALPYTLYFHLCLHVLTDHCTHFPIFQHNTKKKGSPYLSKYKVMPLANDQVDRPIQSEHLKSFLLQSSCHSHSYNAFILCLISTSSKKDTLALWWTHRGNFTLKHAGRSRHWPWVNSGSNQPRYLLINSRFCPYLKV